MLISSNLKLRSPETGEPADGPLLSKNLSDDLENIFRAICKYGPDTAIVTWQGVKNTAPLSGSQVVWNMSGWAASPFVIVHYLQQYAIACNVGSITPTQVNAFCLVIKDGRPLDDGTGLLIGLMAIGQAQPGKTPIIV